MMKKLLFILSLGVVLSSCGDEGEKPVKADNTADKTAVVSETENPKTEPQKPVDETKDNSKKMGDHEEKSAVKNHETSDKAPQMQVEEKSSVAQIEPQAETSQDQKAQQTKPKRNAKKTRLSPEERRIGESASQGQIIVGEENHICSYPYLSAEERRVNNCRR